MNLYDSYLISKIKNNKLIKENDTIINERLFSIRLNREEIISLYCLPIYLKELAFGILFQEKIITSLKQISSFDVNKEHGIIDIIIENSDIKYNLHNKTLQRRFLSPDCTNPTLLTSISDEILCEPVDTNSYVRIKNLQVLLKQFNNISKLYKLTGGTHSAALCNNENILFYNEDISRHNCIDKIIGWAFIKGLKLSDKFLITTGRISGSMVIKAVKSAIPIVISRSAATSEAIRIAIRYNLSIAGFARGSRLNIYTYPERFIM